MRSRMIKTLLIALCVSVSSLMGAGCTIGAITIDPDLTFRAALSVASDVAIFLLENAAVTVF